MPTYLAGNFLRRIGINPEESDFYYSDYYYEDYYYTQEDSELNLGQIEALAIFYQWDQAIIQLK